MVKKIIALSIAFVLMLSSVLYGTIDFTNSPVQFGKGDGTDTVIESPEELEQLLNNIPSVKDYFTNESMTVKNPNFQTFTMVEEGGGKTLNTNFAMLGAEKVIVDNESDLYHVLEICFADDAVYYHCEGETVNTQTYFACTPNNSRGSFKSAARVVTSFDIEIYYAKDVMMIKYNDYDIKAEKAGDDSGRWEADEEKFDAMTLAIFDALEECYGKWMQVKELTESEMAGIAGLPQQEAEIESMIIMYCNEFSSAWVDNIVSSTENNTRYITLLSGFINGNLDTAFDKIDSTYYLKSGSETRASYLSSLGISPLAFNFENSDANATFNVNSDVITVEQVWDLFPKSNASSDASLDCVTTFKNIGNTKVSLKDAEYSSVYDVFGDAIRDVFEDMMAGGGNNG